MLQTFLNDNRSYHPSIIETNCHAFLPHDHDMTPASLQAMRKYLLLSVPEAAATIGGVNDRTWRYYEGSPRPTPLAIPEHVTTTLREMYRWRQNIFRMLEECYLATLKAHPGRERLTYAAIWYDDASDWQSIKDQKAAYWRPYCSAVAELAMSFDTDLLTFDRQAYARWRKTSERAGEVDTLAARLSFWVDRSTDGEVT